MNLFLHTEGSEDPEVIAVEATAVVRILLPANSDEYVWIEEADEEIDLDLTFEAAGIHHHHHVHRGRCRRVKVVIQFNADDFAHEYGPGTTIKTIYDWASGEKAANLSPEQRAKYALAVPGADHFLADGVHIGSLLVAGGPCEVTLNLLPRDSFAG